MPTSLRSMISKSLAFRVRLGIQRGWGASRSSRATRNLRRCSQWRTTCSCLAPRHLCSDFGLHPRCCRTFTTTLWSHAPVAAAFLRMLRNASRTFRAGTGPSGPQSVTCPSGPLNPAADGRRHFYWCLPDIAPFVFWRPRGMFSITSCLHIACHRLWA